MRKLASPGAVQKLVAARRRAGDTVGLVPTMGALHLGHASLLARARAECDFVAASLFVNPTQFGDGFDLARYPRTLRQDQVVLKREGCDLLFVPTVADMYPPGFESAVLPASLGDVLEGAHRPGHFQGVATVCLKLFSICQPHRAYFGAKDYQQALVVRRMAADFNLEAQLVLCPTVRDPDGLALSSRNRFLSPAQRKVALALPETLARQAQRLQNGTISVRKAESEGKRALSQVRGLALDYFSIREKSTLLPPGPKDRELVILAAARVGKTRLIDNIQVSLKSRS